MAPIQTQTAVFRRGSNVLEYWLAHAEGFEVAPRRGGGRVEGVVVDPLAGRARGLVVRSGVGRRRLLPADAIGAVEPFAQRLHLDDRLGAHDLGHGHRIAGLVPGNRDTRQPLAPRAAAAARAAVSWSRPRLAHAVASAGRYAKRLRERVGAAAAWVRPRARTQAEAAGLAAITLAAVLARATRRIRARVVGQAHAAQRRRSSGHADERATRTPLR